MSHRASSSVACFAGLNDSPAPVYSCGHAPINFADSGCTASYSFAGDANHNGSSDTKTYIIAKAESATAVTVAGGVSFTYDGLSHPATVAVTGIGGLNDSPAPERRSTHLNTNHANTWYAASYRLKDDANHNGSSD